MDGEGGRVKEAEGEREFEGGWLAGRPVAMVLGKLLQSVLNNARLIEKLSETPPIRRAAQITVYLISRLELGGRNAAQRLSQSSTARQLRERTNIPRKLDELSKRAAQLRDTWAKELREGMKETSGQKKQK